MGEQKKSGDAIPWLLIILLFAFGLWPIALVILFVKLFGKDKKEDETKTKKTVKQVTKSPVPKASTAKTLKIAGVVLLAVGLLSCNDPVSMLLWLGFDAYELEDLLTGLAIAAAGGGLLIKGISMDKSLHRYARYLAAMGDREAVSVEELSRVLGLSAERVEKDLQKMIERSYFGGQAYLNQELGYLVRSSGAEESIRRQQAEAKAAEKPRQPSPEEMGYSGILREIRRANDEIADPVLSEKIDRLENIAGRIFRIVEEDPEKKATISTFFNYYLPTTLKLLNAYAKFESAGIEGENLHLAKDRIESTMDTIISGFEHQLDLLYRGDALDVDRDIRVMETMLNRDTATAERDFGLDGSKPH